MRRLRSILTAGSLLFFTLNPAPAHALSKQAGGIALVIVGSLAVAGGAALYAARYTAEDLDSPATAYAVAGAGVASIITGVILINKAKSEKKQSSLRLTPMHDGIALAYHF